MSQKATTERRITLPQKNDGRQTLKSTIDQSVNFVETQLTGFLQSRYVRKVQDYFICYLSSQSGCAKKCKFCHLTATGQDKDVKNADYQDYISQAIQVFRHYRKEAPSKYMHYNFMARGQALSNKNMIDRLMTFYLHWLTCLLSRS